MEWHEDAEGHRSGRYEHGRPGWLRLKAQLHRPDVAGIHAGSAQDKKQLFNTLLERIETRDGELTKLVPRAWANRFPLAR